MVRHPLDGQGLEGRADRLGELAVAVLRELPLVHLGPLDGLEVVRCEVERLVRQQQHEVMEAERKLVVVPRELAPLAVVVPQEREAPMVVHWDAT